MTDGYPDLKLLLLDLKKHPLPESDQIRIADLMRILPKEGKTALDIGALWGYCSELLTQHFESVTALDLERPSWEYPRVTTVAGDITELQFEDNSFDCVFCAEVLEHIPAVERAAAELSRVTRRHVVIGTPFMQDLRVGRMTCPHCGRVTPGYGHVNSFDEKKLKNLFRTLVPVATSLVLPQPAQRTNPLSTWLMDLARNPNGPYDQLEPCIHCGKKLSPPADRSLFEKGCSFLANRLNREQNRFLSDRPAWIHMVFRKERAHGQ
jgi:ubiquinone/menaquinone biosynthesis C-methylase UbiE